MLNEHIKRTKTKTGLDVTTTISEGIYTTGRKAKKGFKKNMPIKFDDYLPKWNYVAEACF